MSESPRAGERGVSILGALVVALMLGAGSIATFELATPSLSSVSENSQVAAIKLAAGPTAKTPPKATAGEKCINVIACDQATPVNVDSILTQPCTPGFKYEIRETGGKVQVKPAPKHAGTCKDAGFSDAQILKASDNAAPKGAVPTGIKEIKCDASSIKKGHIKPGETANCEYEYCTSLKLRATRDRGGNPALAAQQSDGDCSDGELGAGKTFGELRSVARAEAIGKIVEGMTKDQLARIDPSELTGLDPRAQGPLQDALSGAKQGIDNTLAEKRDRDKEIDEILKKCATPAGCAGHNQNDLKAEKQAIAADSRDLLDQKNKLAALQRTLADEAAKGPPGKDDTVTCTGGVCKNSKGETVPPPGPGTQNPGPGTSGPGGGTPDSSANNSKGGGMGDIGSLLKSLGSLFNQQQQQLPCVSDQNQYNQQLQSYQMQLQSYNQQLQQYNYTRQLQSVYGSTGFTPEPPTQPAQPCFKPSPTNSCQQAPAQPDPTGCQNGSWKPTYTGACLSGWQCVPTSGSGTGSGGSNLITALLTCQPQVVDVGMNVSITYSCSSGTSEGGGFETGGAQSGSTTVAISSPPAGTNVATFGLKCTGTGTGATKQCSVQIGKPGIVLIANPKNVKDDQQTAIGWVTSGMKSCVISSDDLPQFTSANANKTNVNGTVQTPPLDAVNGSTTSYDFLLHCITVGGNTKDAALSVTASI